MLERVSNLVRTGAPRPRGLRTMLAAALLTVATYAAAVELRGDHPDTYVVKRGDTLWDISGTLPEEAVAVAGDLAGQPADQEPAPDLSGRRDQPGLPRPRGGQGAGRRTHRQPDQRRAAGRDRAVPARYLAWSTSLDDLPYVVGLEEDRLRGVRGQVAYVRGLDGIAPGQRYLVVRPEKRYRIVDRAGRAATCSRARTSTPAVAPARTTARSGPIRCSRARTPSSWATSWCSPDHRHRHPRRSRRHPGQHRAAGRAKAAKSASATAWCRSRRSPTTCSSSRIRPSSRPSTAA